MALLDAIATKTIPAVDVPRRRSASFARSTTRPSTIKSSPSGHLPRHARRPQAAHRRLAAEAFAHSSPDLAAGRAIFAKTCQQCHTLYGVGANVGPDITGSNRADLNYLLENIFDPSAIIPKEYAATTFDLLDGRKVTGIVKEDGAQIVVITATETVKFTPQDVDKRKPSDLSMMPDDLTKQLSDLEVKNLIAYLRHPCRCR